jgi:hypothetical protein
MIEIKRSTAPAISRKFHVARADLGPTRQFVVYPGVAQFPMGDGTEAIGLDELCRLAAAGP